MPYKKWIVADADKEKASVLSEKLNIDPLIAFLLVSRGIDDELTASAFLFGNNAYSSPYSFKDMDKAVERINKAIDCSERICVYGDYDCDGVTATALLYSVLESLGADVIYYIPNRLTEGYGMNSTAIDTLKAKGTDLIITVDNGISSVETAEYIYSLGMELVITDHHQIGDILPRAEAVVNPHRAENDLRFRDFAGVGVAFKLACALYDGEVREIIEQYADLVAIGTIGDVVSLRDENRELVKEGLRLINENTRIGLMALKNAAGSSEDGMTASDIAFQICPRINAAGRMDDACKALELLICDDYEDAVFRAQQLNTENAHRHEVETNILNDINDKLMQCPSLTDSKVIVIEGNNYHKGVIGIVASHIVSQYGKPAIVFSVDENGEATGSARSVDGFDIFDAISHCSEALTHYGGHPLAAGLGIMAENIDAFRKQINDYAMEKYPVMPADSIKIDCKLSPFYLEVDLVDNLKALEPCGADNTQPVFCLSKMYLDSVTPMGDGKHIRLQVSKKGKSFRIVKFKTTAQELPYKPGDLIDIAVSLSKSFFKGKYYLSIRAVDIRKNGIDSDKFFFEKSDYELFKLGGKNKTDIYPSRDVCALIYKFLKQNNGWAYSIEDLYFALEQSVTYGQLCFALDAFEECGLVDCTNNIEMKKVSGKADLENTNILKTLKGRI